MWPRQQILYTLDPLPCLEEEKSVILGKAFLRSLSLPTVSPLIQLFAGEKRRMARFFSSFGKCVRSGAVERVITLPILGTEEKDADVV